MKWWNMVVFNVIFFFFSQKYWKQILEMDYKLIFQEFVYNCDVQFFVTMYIINLKLEILLINDSK